MDSRRDGVPVECVSFIFFQVPDARHYHFDSDPFARMYFVRGRRRIDGGFKWEYGEQHAAKFAHNSSGHLPDYDHRFAWHLAANDTSHINGELTAICIDPIK